jgi:excisionase family DNA binding protein
MSTEILTPPEVAEKLKISERTVLNLLRSGEIPGVKIGGQWRVSSAAIDTIMLPPAREALAVKPAPVEPAEDTPQRAYTKKGR